MALLPTKAQLISKFVTKGGFRAAVAQLIDWATTLSVETAFATYPNTPTDLSVKINRGVFNVGGTPTSQADQSVGGFVATSSTSRIDIVVLDTTTLLASRVAGVESATPVAPATPSGKILLATVGPFITTTTAISQSMITDLRTGGDRYPSSGNTNLSLLVANGSGGVAWGAAGQIAFPAIQNPSANANTLDDYEEGTWTPNVGGTATYTTQQGSYTRIGRLGYVKYTLAVNVIGTGSANTISGLPFTSTENSSIPLNNWTSTAVGYTYLTTYTGVSSTSIVCTGTTAASATIGVVSAITSGTTLIGSGCFHT